MKTLSPQQKAVCMEHVLDACDAFAACVLPRVAQDREEAGTSHSEQQRLEKIAKGKLIDVRPARLMVISGKGGYSPDPARATYQAQWTNISLMDHLASVARGAAIIVALEYGLALLEGDIEENDDIIRLVGLAMAVGFLHDANKILDGGTRKNSGVSQDEIAELVERFGIDLFLARQEWGTRSAEAWAWELHQLIRGAEVLERDEDVQAACQDVVDWTARQGGALSLSDIERVIRAVRRADRLDGAFLKDGVDGVQKELGVLGNESLGAWDAMVLREPHLPFLLDRLLLCLDAQCQESAGIPAPVLSHMDGDLVALLPTPRPADFFSKTLTRLKNSLPFALDVKLNAKKGLSIIGGQPTWDAMVAHFQKIGSGGKLDQEVRRAMELMAIHKNLSANAVFSCLRQAWAPLDLGHVFGAPSVGTVGKYDPLIPQAQVELLLKDPAPDSDWKRWLAPLQALVAILLAEPGKHKGCLTPDQRRDALVQLLEQQGWAPPAELAWNGKEAFTDAVRLAFWAVPVAGAAGKDELLWEFGRALMAGYTTQTPKELGVLEGHTMGLTALFPAAWQDEALAQLEERWCNLVEGRPLATQAETEGPRCLFLDMPIAPKSEPIGTEFGLYQVKASAFSGRSGRPDHLMGAPASPCNYVSPIMRLEHALRQVDFAGLGQAGKGVAMTVSTPLRTGLFAGIKALKNDSLETFESKPRDVSTYELLTQDTAKRYIQTETLVMEQAIPKQGYRLSRFESLPARLEDRVEFYLRWAQAARRFGRPVHLFRGIPRPSKSFLVIDSLSHELHSWLGGREWRMEQLEGVIERLELARWMMDKSKGGPGLAWFQRLADPTMQWIVAAWLLARDAGEDDAGKRLPPDARNVLKTLLDTHLRNPMNHATSAPAMQQLAALNARFQMIKGAFYKLSNNEKALAWNGARELWEKHRDHGLGATIGAADYVAGGLRDLLDRKGKLLGTNAAVDALNAFADLFVQHAAVLVGNPDLRQSITGAYVHLFERAVSDYWKQRNEEQSTSTPDQATA